MAKINSDFLNLKERYLFTEIERRKKRFILENPDADIIDMGVGDVTLPLPEEVIKAMGEAVREMGNKETFKGYGSERGYRFLREKIAESYAEKGVNLTVDEIFVSDGAGNDLGTFPEILSKENTVLITDPVYPAYADISTMDGRKISYLAAKRENSFLPLPPSEKYDIIYLCSPNNPTGAVYNKSQLKLWVDYANENGSVIIFDAAYEGFVQGDFPKSIYEIEEAKKCAVEICSYSKTAGFTGVRCGYTVVPNELVRENVHLNSLWFRRQSTKTNGVSYITQKGAAAIYTEKGKREINENLEYYRKNAEIITDTLKEMKAEYTGGENSPYIWVKCPSELSGWDFFDYVLKTAHTVITPGDGFGENGKGYFRLTAFSTHEKTVEAMKRFREMIF